MVLTFLAAATILIVAPGPDSMLVLRNAIRDGMRRGLITAAGTVSGLVAWSVAAALGLSALLAASQVGYDALRIAGGAYLIWLGYTSWRTRPATHPIPLPDSPDTTSSAWRCYTTGLLSNLLNPKIGVFFVAFLPAFLPQQAASGPTVALLGALFVIETGLWLALLVWSATRAARFLSRPTVRRRLDQATAVVLIGFGVRLIADSRAPLA